MCPACWQKITWIARPYCAITGAPFTHDYGDAAVSADAIANPPPYDHARAVAIHTGAARQLVTRLKYNDQLALAPMMASWMVRAGNELLSDADLIMPVPLHWQRQVGRRYNQSAELARLVARQAGLVFDAETIMRKRPTRPQVGLSANSRTENVRGVFAVRAGRNIEVHGRNIVLVDDVFTTGATVNSAAKALKRAKAARVDVLTFSRVVDGFVEPAPPRPRNPLMALKERLYRGSTKGDRDG